MTHGLDHLTRAVLEGVAFGLRDGLDLMVEAGVTPPTRIRAAGGGTASPLWRQILADVLEAEIDTVETTEGAAYGGAVLAAVGAGWRDSVSDVAADWVHPTTRAEPGLDHQRYREVFQRYRELYPALSPVFHQHPAA